MTRFIDTYLLYLLAQASSQASAEFHAQLAQQGVKVANWRVLASLYPDVSASIGELAAACMIKQPTMTRQIDRLEQSGLVQRRHGKTDRRRVAVQLTDAGRAVAGGLTQQARRHETEILQGLSPRDIEQLKRLLSQLTAR